MKVNTLSVPGLALRALNVQDCGCV